MLAACTPNSVAPPLQTQAAAPAPQAENKEAVPLLQNGWASSTVGDEANHAAPKIPAGGIFKGSGAFIYEAKEEKKLPAAAADAPQDGMVLNFVNADVREVAKAVLGDMLHLNYVIAPTVQGTVTIQASQSLPKESMLSVLNTAFRLNGLAIVERGDVVKVVPIADAPRQGELVGRKIGGPGFGMQIVPLRYIGAEEMRKLLESAAPTGAIIPVESTRNILIIAGNEDDRTAIMDLVRTFDVDWLAGMSFGLFPLKEANAKTVVNELWEILGSPTGPLGKMVRLMPLERLNAVLAISSQPRYLKEVRTWINRLDYDQAPSERRMWVYQVQNGRASNLSETLSKLVNNQTGLKQGKDARKGKSAMPPMPSAMLSPEAPMVVENVPEASPDNANADGLRIIADESTNTLIIMGTKAEFTIIENALKKLDIVPLQVRIEAVIAEVTLTDDLKYGVQYLFKSGDFSSILTKASTLSVNSALPGFSAFVTSSKISAVLDLLQSVTKVNVISSPQLMVLNNQTAVLQIGDQVPVATQSAVTVQTPGAPVVNTIEMKDTGVILKVTPRVNASGMVIMDISQEVSEVAKTTTSGLDSPTIRQRKIASSVAVRDGTTIALGGLIKDSMTNGQDGIPLLQDIPVVGSLFGSTTEAHTRTELLALITPRVIHNDKDVRDITEEMRQQMRAVAPLNEKIR
jgi:general secretion pathway protein D